MTVFETIEHEGQTYDRITSILSWLDPYEGIADPAHFKRMTNVGKQLHHVIQQSLLRATLRLPKPQTAEFKSAWQAWQRWRDIHSDLTILAVEERLYDPELLITGEPDCVTDSEIIDWKTSARLTFRHELQVMIYLDLLRRVKALTLPQARLVRCDRFLADYQEKIVPWNETIVEAFVQLLPMYRLWRDRYKELEGRRP